jgi:hypothetical protein
MHTEVLARRHHPGSQPHVLEAEMDVVHAQRDGSWDWRVTASTIWSRQRLRSSDVSFETYMVFSVLTSLIGILGNNIMSARSAFARCSEVCRWCRHIAPFKVSSSQRRKQLLIVQQKASRLPKLSYCSSPSLDSASDLLSWH